MIKTAESLSPAQPVCKTQAPLRSIDDKSDASVLVVEDSLPERARVVAILNRLGYSTLEASNGSEALNILSEYNVSLIITDWHMPVMNGLDLCKEIVSQSGSKPYLIMLTGRNAKCDLISGMDGGADDYLSKPFDSEELRVRVQSALRMVNMQHQLIQQNELLQSSLKRENRLNKAVQKDLAAAQKLQRATLPSSNQSINGTYCAHFFEAAAGVAGDTFSVLPLGHKHIAFYQIDVVGHGIRSAMLSYAVTRYLHEHAKHPPTSSHSLAMQSPARVLQALNAQFSCGEDCDDYFTMVYGVLNTETGEGQLAQAGHPHPVMINSRGQINRLESGGIPIGLFTNSQYSNQPFQLDWGSRLFLHTDGLYECRLSDGRALSELAVEQLFKGLSSVRYQDIQVRINQLFKKLLNNQSPVDDLSLLTLERRPDVK